MTAQPWLYNGLGNQYQTHVLFYWLFLYLTLLVDLGEDLMSFTCAWVVICQCGNIGCWWLPRLLLTSRFREIFSLVLLLCQCRRWTPRVFHFRRNLEIRMVFSGISFFQRMFLIKHCASPTHWVPVQSWSCTTKRPKIMFTQLVRKTWVCWATRGQWLYIPALTRAIKMWLDFGSLRTASPIWPKICV